MTVERAYAANHDYAKTLTFVNFDDKYPCYNGKWYEGPNNKDKPTDC